MCFDCDAMISCNCDGSPVFGKCPASYGLDCSVCGHSSNKAKSETVSVNKRILHELLKPEVLNKARK